MKDDPKKRTIGTVESEPVEMDMDNVPKVVIKITPDLADIIIEDECR